MDRKKALEILNARLSNKNLVKHSLAVEVAMRSLAQYFNQDPELWGLAGLLHDLDYEVTSKKPQNHGVLTEQWLGNENLPNEIFTIIKAHNSDNLGTDRQTKAEMAIYAVDPLTGLITAAALMTPSKSLISLSAEYILKKYKTKNFAAGASRENIATCEEMGLSLNEFVSIVLKAMQSISNNLGL